MFETRITKLFGIKYPIICGCMQNVSTPEFVAAVCNAGAMAVLSSVMCETTSALRDAIRKVKDLTDQPFAVNVNLFPSARPVSTEAYIDVINEEGAQVVETSGRSPKPYVERIRQGGAKFMHKCARARDAITTERLGADAVSIVGYECAGHPGMDDVTTMVLGPLTADLVKVPVIVGGGIYDGRGLLAALALGAEAVVMGTRFMATKECPIHDSVKEWMLKATEVDTTVIQRSIQSNARVIKNGPAAKVLELEAKGTSLEELLPLISGERGKLVIQNGDMEAGTFACGEVVGLINNVPPVSELVQSIMAEAVEARQRVNRL